MATKKFNVYRIIWGCLFCCIMNACHDEEDTIKVFSGKTVLVYMVADNSLTNYANINMDSIASGLKSSNCGSKVLVYADRRDGSPELICIENQGNGRITRSVLKTYPEQNSVSPTVMTTVLRDMTQSAPAESYGLILWSHGYGWIPANNNTKTTTRWFGQDGSYYMEIPELVTAMNNCGTHFSYILFDACFMGSIETCYALRYCADYIIASPAEILAAGFPYQSAIPYLLGSTENDYVKAATCFYDFYSNQKDELRRSGTISCVKCSELNNMATQTKAIMHAHATELSLLNTSGVQYFEGYKPHVFHDMGSYVQLFATTEELKKIEEQFNKTVVYKAHTDKVLSATSWGNTYIPINTFSGFNTYLWLNGSSAVNDAAYKETEWYAAVFKDIINVGF